MKHLMTNSVGIALLAGLALLAIAPGPSAAEDHAGRTGSSAPLSTPTPAAAQQTPALSQQPPPVASVPAVDRLAPEQPTGGKPIDPLAKQAVGTIATLEGKATVTRAGSDAPLKVGDYVLNSDILQTGPSGQLGVTFDDGTTFNLAANARMEVNNFVFQKGASSNAALFTVTRGTVGFTSSQVAKTGDLKIATPKMTLAGPGASGLIELPDADGAAAAGSQVADAAVKLYADDKGNTGRIDIYKTGSDGTRLAQLTKPGTGYSIRSAADDITAIALKIPPEQVKKDRAVVHRVFTIQIAGARLVAERQVLLGLPLPGIPGIALPVALPVAIPIPVPGILPTTGGGRKKGRANLPGFGLPGLHF